MGSSVQPVPSRVIPLSWGTSPASASTSPLPPIPAAPSESTSAGRVIPLSWKGNQPSPIPSPAPGGISDVIAHGLGGGPANALVDAITNPSSYHGHFWENMKSSQQQFNNKVADYSARNPKTAAATEAVSSAVPLGLATLLSGGAAAPEEVASGIAQAAPMGLLKRMAVGSATGAVAEQAATAINTPGSPVDRLKGVVNSGFPWAGALTGAALPVASSAMSALAERTPWGAGAGSTRATGTFLERLGQNNMAPEDLSEAARTAPPTAPIVAADLMGRPGQKLIRWTTDHPSLGGAQLEQQLTDRNTGQLDRTLGNMKASMGQDFQNIPATMEQLKADMLTRAKPVYDAANAEALSPKLTDEVNQLRSDFPEYDKAMSNGERLRQGEAALQAQQDRAAGKTPAPTNIGPKASAIRAQFPDDPKLADAFIAKLGLPEDETPAMTVGDVHYTKLGLDDLINSYANKGGVAPNRAMQLQQSLSTLLDQMEAEHPTYGVARSQYRGDKEIQAAMDLGKKALHLPVDELQVATQGYTPGETQAFQASAMDQMKQAASNVDTRKDMMARWLASPNMEARLRLIAPSDEAAQSMLANRDVERTMAATGAAPRAGSNTSTNLADQPGSGFLSGSQMGRALVGQPRRTLGNLAGAAGEAAHRSMQTTLSDNLGPMLGADRTQIPELVRRLQDAKSSAFARAVAERLVAGVAGYHAGATQRAP